MPRPKGHSHERMYATWKEMKRRCDSPNSIAYKYYGAKGISYDPRWASFVNFRDDMFPSFIEGLTLDRINPRGNYTKENCRWADRITQARNTTRTNLIEYKGVKMTIMEWAEKFNIKRSTLSMRIYVYRWPIERCIEAPVRERTTNYGI